MATPPDSMTQRFDATGVFEALSVRSAPREDGLPQSAGSNTPIKKNGNVCIYRLRSLPQPTNGSFKGAQSGQ
jgi:hypothetical protein